MRITIANIVAVVLILASSLPARYSGGSGSVGNPYLIGSEADLMLLAAQTQDYDACFKLVSDLDLSGQGDNSDGTFSNAVIAPGTPDVFTGMFDGNGYTIRNLGIHMKSNADNVGLFGIIGSGGVVANLNLTDVSIYSIYTGARIGGVAGACGYGSNYLGGQIVNCHVSGVVDAGYAPSVGGVAGFSNGGALVGCTAAVTIDGKQNVGGVIGHMEFGEVAGCVAAGTVNASNGFCGGIVGEANDYNDILNCQFEGTVNGGTKERAGGIVGSLARYSTALDCYSDVTVECYEKAGGIAGLSNGIIRRCYSRGMITVWDYTAGGVVGVNENEGFVYDCSTQIDIYGKYGADRLGGIAGVNQCLISRCRATGSVNASYAAEKIGGGIGYNDRGDLVDCYAACVVTGQYDVKQIGGFVGRSYGSYNIITGCYWDYQVAGISVSEAGVGLTTAQMQDAANLAFDFVGDSSDGNNDYWYLPVGGGYAMLWWENPLVADGNCDAVVDGRDLDLFIREWQMEGTSGYRLKSDFNLDGVVDMFDHAILSERWLRD